VYFHAEIATRARERERETVKSWEDMFGASGKRNRRGFLLFFFWGGGGSPGIPIGIWGKK